VATPRKDHPNNAPGVPMVFPPFLHRLQVRYFNPMIMPLARRSPGFAIIKHRGRKSGKPYETIVNAHHRGNTLTVALAHGNAESVRNVLAAGEAEIHLFRRHVHIVNPRVLPAGTHDPSLPSIARLGARRTRMGLFLADIA
jgi:deazaflavin-dependent oxidoreductase (nitroreductase family)